MRINNNGLITTSGNIDCGGGIALNGSTAFFTDANVDLDNKTNTYINFKVAGAGNDWCYLRQIGTSEAYKLAFDFHDDNNDARFCLRSVEQCFIIFVDILYQFCDIGNDKFLHGNIKAS